MPNPGPAAVQGAEVPNVPSPGDFLDGFVSLLPSMAALVAVVAVALLLRKWLEARAAATTESHQMRNQLVFLGLTSAGGVLVVLLLPISDALRGQILSLIGIVLSAGVALSSTTFLGNMLAGLMLRAVRSFRVGDFVRVKDHFGRVSERGLFHTEIQTQTRELTTLPNLYLVTNPVTTVRTSGTVVTAGVSLGYDVPRDEIRTLLLEAATEADLEDPFVLVEELGDFSVSYRVAGLLSEVDSLITARSRLRCAVLDALHGGGVEIVSPTFMNQRRVEEGRKFIPRPTRREGADAEAVPEELVFDKAVEAEKREERAARISRLQEEIDGVKAELEGAEEGARPVLERTLDRLRGQREHLRELVESGADGAGGSGA